jgi:hypothetical protein
MNSLHSGLSDSLHIHLAFANLPGQRKSHYLFESSQDLLILQHSAVWVKFSGSSLF